MHAIQVFLNVQTIRLLFRTKEAAGVAWEMLTNPEVNSLTMDGKPAFTPIMLKDDFGTAIKLNEKPGAILCEDMVQSAEGAIEHQLHLARTQQKLNMMAQQDPKLGGLARGGPAILSPMHAPNGRGF